MTRIRRLRPSAIGLAAALSTMALYACNQGGQQQGAQNSTAATALPLTTGAETAPVYAPSAAALPAAPRPKIVRVASQADQYAYVDQAATMGSALGSAPPDYGFDYGGVHPWVWRAGNNAARLVEPTDGGDRYYYYQPGASEPYLIRDPRYAYGFDNGQLVVVYDGRGNVLPPQYMDQQADYAGRYLARARALYSASLSRERHSVIAANWAARRAEIDAQQADWARQQAQYSAWQAYHQQHDAEQQAYWKAERQHRDAEAHQFDQWRGGGYQGPPPPPSYAPAAGEALVGGAVGGYPAGRNHHDDHRGPPSGLPIGAAPQPFDGRPAGDLQPGRATAIEQARQQQAQANAERQTQLQSQARAASMADDQAVAQGRQQQATAEAAHQAEATARANAQSQALAARQAKGAARLQAHQQQATDAAAQRQAQETTRAQAVLAHQQQATQVAAQREALNAAKAQAAAAHAAHPEGPHEHPHPDGKHPPDGAPPPP